MLPRGMPDVHIRPENYEARPTSSRFRLLPRRRQQPPPGVHRLRCRVPNKWGARRRRRQRGQQRSFAADEEPDDQASHASADGEAVRKSKCAEQPLQNVGHERPLEMGVQDQAVRELAYGV